MRRTMSDRRRYAALGVIALSLALAYGIWYSYSVILVALLDHARDIGALTAATQEETARVAIGPSR